MPKVELDELRLAKGVITDNVYVGKLNKKGDSWLNKVDITNDFITAVLERWSGYSEEIIRGDGKKFRISVKEIEE